MFARCTSLENITIPISVTSIEDAAFDKALSTIYFRGTTKEWETIQKATARLGGPYIYLWNDDDKDYTIHCTDGDIVKADDI